MASIYKKDGRWKALIRKVGYPAKAKTFPTKYAAEQWAAATEQAMVSGSYAAPTKLTGKSLFERFAAEVSPTHRGARWERVRIDLMIRTMAFLNKPASKIHKADLQAWRDRRLEQVSGASVNREMNLVSAIFNHAIREWGVGMVNPVKGVRRPAKAESRRRRVADSEVEALKEYFGFDLAKPPRRGYGSSKDSVMWIFLLALETGMRLGEICGTRWGNVHVEERYIRVPKELAKNGYARNVPLTKYACKIIEALPRGEGDGLVFPPSSEVVGALFRKGCKNLGLVNLHFHDTRHEACTKLARKLSILELADAIGHRELKSLQTYFNPEPHEIASKLD